MQIQKFISVLFRCFVARISATIRNNYDDMGQPCFRARVALKNGDLHPLLSTDDDISLYKIFIQVMKSFLKPHFASALNIKFHSTVSTAFLKPKKKNKS